MTNTKDDTKANVIPITKADVIDITSKKAKKKTTKVKRKKKTTKAKQPTKPKAKRAAGRPRKGTFTLKQAYEAGRVGLSYESIGHMFSLSKATVISRMKENKGALLTEYKRGKANTNQYLRSVLIKRADTNATCLIFALKNYCGFADKPEDRQVDDTAEVGPQIRPRKLKNGAVVYVPEGTDIDEYTADATVEVDTNE